MNLTTEFQQEKETMNFKTFGTAVARQFQKISASPLFQVDIEADLLWQTYLASFPAGTNPTYKTRTEHDCGACRSFVRTVGGVVSIKDGVLSTIWDWLTFEEGYQSVADAMGQLVRSRPIDNLFLHTEKTAGTGASRQLLEDKSVKTWDHFFVNLPITATEKKDKIGPRLSETRTTHDVMLRSLTEIPIESIDTVLELIAQNSLYRGEENRFALDTFRKLHVQFDQVASEARDLFVWENAQGTPESVARIRNTAIGTLLVDISKGDDLDDAVKAFETKVAPTNYKRPTALVTKAMIARAQETINELGFGSALERRYATIEDITVNNILFADRAARKEMNVFDQLAKGLPEQGKKFDKVEEIGIEAFLTSVLPRAQSIEVLVENHHTANLMSLIAPCDPTAKGMFKWPNNFSWSYAGDVADSIKERVKKAGGTVIGDLCCRLAWDYTDDLDFHMQEPGGGHIYWSTKRRLSPCGGILDVDANGGDGIRENPVENIFYANQRTMQEGRYLLAVNNYQRRSAGVGFEVEIEFDGQVHSMAFDKVLKTGETVAVAIIAYSRLQGFKIIESLPTTQATKQVWGLPTQTFHRAKVVMLSPNHWDDRTVGNKHYFFMLDGCRNEEKARGFYNEFLNESLAEHRKVLEMVGAKMKTDESDRQLSGLGFSSTQRNSVVVRVGGNVTRVVKVLF